MLMFLCFLYLIIGLMGMWIISGYTVRCDMSATIGNGFLNILSCFIVISSLIAFLMPDYMKIRYLLLAFWPVLLLIIYYIVYKNKID